MIRWIKGLQGKFFVGLLIAAVLPFCIGLAVFGAISYRHEVGEQGRIQQMEAATFASAIHQAAEAEGGDLNVWLNYEPDLMQFVVQKNKDLIGVSPQRIAEKVRILDEIWASLPDHDPEIRAVLENSGAQSLIRYQQLHPRIAEMMVTDSRGRLIAATQKTTDVYQADELWWKCGAKLGSMDAPWINALHQDRSAKNFVIEVVLPLYHGSEFMGVAKMSVIVRDLIPRLILRGSNVASSWMVVLANGRVLVGSDSDKYHGVGADSPNEILAQINSSPEGYLVGVDQYGKKMIIGYQAIMADTIDSGNSSIPNAYIVFTSSLDDFLSTRWVHFFGFSIGGFCLLGICLIVGYCLIQRRVLRPIGLIEKAVMSLSQLARLRNNPHHNQEMIRAQHAMVDENLRAIRNIRSGDQLEVLAQNVATLIARVLNYQAETEIGKSPPSEENHKAAEDAGREA